jgi:WD40 repeat protein
MAATTLPEGGEVVALVLSQNKLVIRLFSGDNFASRPRLEKPLNGQVTAMTWDALGRFLWLGWKDGRVTAWKITKKDDNFLVEERIVVKAHDSSVSMISFLGNGLRFATGSHQGQLAFWGCP